MSDSKDKNNKKETEGAVQVFRAVAVIFAGILISYFVYTTSIGENSSYPFKLGLDLAGGSHLIYQADVSSVDPNEVRELMNVLRDVIERRVNIFGVSEPIVQIETSSFVAGETAERLVVELPGVTDVEGAIEEIGRTPLLEFRIVNQEALAAQNSLQGLEHGSTSAAIIGDIAVSDEIIDEVYIDVGLTGRYLERAELIFGGQGGGHGGLSNEPIVSVRFNSEGAQIFEDVTRANVGEQLAIFLDGNVVSSPVINEAIVGGSAIISGSFTAEEARDLVQNLNFGALPLPIELQSTQTIGASLGAEILEKGIVAGVIGLTLVIGFMLVWYRLPGVVAGIALLIYLAIMLSLFKLIPVTLTAAGLAGLILSLGMAVDANVLVFERMKEEYRNGKKSREAARIGFRRAFPAIRDGNFTSIISAVILFWFGTSIVKGFALVFGLGVVISMITAIVVTRTILIALPNVSYDDDNIFAKLFGTGFHK